MRVLAVILAVFLIGLQARLWLGEGSVLENIRLRHAVDEQKAENGHLRERNQALEADVRDLKSGLAAAEERARRELGMIGAEERFYQVIDRVE